MNKKKLLVIICVFMFIMMATVTAFASPNPPAGQFASKMLTTAAHNVMGQSEKGYTSSGVALNVTMLNGPGMEWRVQYGPYGTGGNWTNCTPSKYRYSTGNENVQYSPTQPPLTPMRIRALSAGPGETYVSGTALY